MTKAAHAALPARVVHLDEARRKLGDRVERLASFLNVRDPLADDCVQAFAELPPGRGNALLERALAHGIDKVDEAPPALRALFAQLDHVPAWVDWGLMERGGELLLRAGPFGAMVLGFRSLVMAYAAPGGNKPLVMSGRLTEHAARRLAETGRFVHVTCIPGALRRHAEGFRITVKVRLMHAQVRRLVKRTGKWRTDLWGEPVNQHDMVATNLLFSVALIDGLRTLGFRIEDEEAEAYVRLWRYSGYLIGVEPELLATSAADGRRIGNMIEAIQGPPDEDARALVAALFGPGLGTPRTPSEAAFLRGYRRFAMALSRRLVGDELADGVGLPRGPARLAQWLVRPAIGTVERVRERSELARRVMVWAGDTRWQQVVREGLAGDMPSFHMPDKLAHKPEQSGGSVGLPFKI